MHRYFVTGTDTDVGKTRVTAALALALREAGIAPTIVKLVQTGLAPGIPGDAARAGKLAGVRFVELARFEKAADPWSAALAYGLPEVHASELVEAVQHIEHGVVAEGAGGLMVPLNAREHFGHVAALGKMDTILVIGLKLGCLNHALLTINQAQQGGLPIAGAVLVERWGPTEPSYREDVIRSLQGKAHLFGVLPFNEDEAASVKEGAKLFHSFLH
ncbi:MAG TPA: dethiobiotin synthase [Candidatus Baltobacteraceae bacterium]|nr:dethiobiotin synthase [Candidatus Baltobacteraceae bacterium]